MNLNTQSSKTEQTIPIESIIIQGRTRKDFGNINLLAESISSIGLLQPIVTNENNELIDGQRRIEAYELLGISEIPCYIVSLDEIILGEFHANSNRKDFTSSERVAISTAIEEYFSKHSKGIGRPRSAQKSDRTTNKDSRIPPDSTNKETKIMWSN